MFWKFNFQSIRISTEKIGERVIYSLFKIIFYYNQYSNLMGIPTKSSKLKTRLGFDPNFCFSYLIKQKHKWLNICFEFEKYLSKFMFISNVLIASKVKSNYFLSQTNECLNYLNLHFIYFKSLQLRNGSGVR